MGELPATVRVRVPCSTAATPDAPCVVHDVTLHRDGRLDTPHDLDAERVAAAFGGYLSCLHVVDRLLPALPGWWALQTRQAVPRVRRSVRGTWHPTPAATSPCCRPVPAASDAAAHLRSAGHLAATVGLPEPFVRPFTDALLEHAPGDARTADAHVALGCVRGHGALAELWRAGLHPTLVRAVHDRVVGPDGPALPPALYLGAVTRRPDLAWVAETLGAVDAAAPQGMTDDEATDVAEWLTWTQTGLDRQHRTRAADWLVLGVPRAWVADLSASPYSPDDVGLLAAATGRGVVGAVRMLRAWSAVDCHPAAVDLVALHAAGVPAWYQPSGASLTRLASRLADVPAVPDRTALGLALARHGTVAAAERAVRAQVVDRRKVCA